MKPRDLTLPPEVATLYAYRLKARTDRAATGCLVFTGARVKGYGVLDNPIRIYAHRAAWIVTKGDIPAGLFVLHRCDNRACVEIEHLFLGTQRDNMQDCAAKGRTKRQNGSLNHMAKLTEDDARAIFVDPRSTYVIGDEYDINRGQVSAIKLGVIWAHATAGLIPHRNGPGPLRRTDP